MGGIAVKRLTLERVTFSLAALLGLVAILLGGTSQRDVGYFFLVELVAAPVLGLALYTLWSREGWRDHRPVLALTAAIVAVPLVQLAPLPPGVWSVLPGREDLNLASQLLGLPPRWLPMTLTPDATRGALWSLLPPVAMFIATLVLNAEQRTRLAQVAIGGGAISMLLAWAQLISGGDGLYLYSSVDAGSVVGFFTNRNHLATLILMLIPLAAALSLSGAAWGSDDPRVGRWLFGLVLLVAIVTLALTRSRTGIALTAPVVLACLILVWSSRSGRRLSLPVLSLMGIVGAAVTTVIFFGLDPILDRYEALGDRPELRFLNWPLVIEAGTRFQPWGAGLGSFDPVYRSVEPLSQLSPQAFTRAHNDYLEIWLETGWIGLILLGLVLAWAGRAWFGAWKSGTYPAILLSRAAGISILVVVLHSVVDYPVRMEAISVWLAFCLGALTPAAHRDGRRF